jgi:hypothetical protein
MDSELSKEQLASADIDLSDREEGEEVCLKIYGTINSSKGVTLDPESAEEMEMDEHEGGGYEGGEDGASPKKKRPSGFAIVIQGGKH